MKDLNCPKGHGPMALKELEKQSTFKGVDITCSADTFVCPECGIEAGTVKTAGNVQRAIADAYRSKMRLLTSNQIKLLRKSHGLSQQQLADLINVGVASIKRWETGLIQSKSMDHVLRIQLQCRLDSDNYSGNRKISLPRIKLVAKQFEKLIGKRLLKIHDQFLFLAKYLWYADMLAFRQLGRGLTGATYAAIPYGPQLNNYKDLVKPIKASDGSDAEPLSAEELRIIQQVAEKFPGEEAVYEAAHREKAWQEAATGSLIPYSCAYELTEI